jgi:hypothetical protein
MRTAFPAAGRTISSRIDPQEVSDASRWQPDIVDNGYGIFRAQQFVTPQYRLVKPYSYQTPHVFRAPQPKASNIRSRALYQQQVDQVLAASAAMTDRQKMVAELFENKIASLGFSALFASIAGGLSLEQFVWYDFVTMPPRKYTATDLFTGEEIRFGACSSSPSSGGT